MSASLQRRGNLLAEVHADSGALVRAESESVVGVGEPWADGGPPAVVAGDVCIVDVLEWRLEFQQPELRDERGLRQGHSATSRPKAEGKEQREVPLVDEVLELLWHRLGI